MYDKASLVQIPSGYKGGSPNGTLYSVLPANGDGDFTHTRATSATRVNKDGLIESVASNVPRLDYPLIDGVVQDCPHLLLEPSRTNKITYSIPDSNWAIENGASITEDYGISPDGSQNASRVQLPTGVLARIHKSFTVDSNEDSVSFYIKSNTGSNFNVSFYLRDSGFGTVRYQDTSLEVTTEWQRVKIENQDLSAASVQVMILFYNTLGSGDTWDFSLWGVQAEGGSYTTSYIPTSGSTVTRNADVCENAGNAYLFNDNEGVLFAEFSMLNDSDTSNRYISLSDGSPDNSIMFQITSGGDLNLFNNGTSSENRIDTYSADLTQSVKVAVQYGQSTGDYKVYVNGVSQSLNSGFVSETISGLDRLSIDYPIFDFKFNGKIKQLMVFNEALTDAELIELTS